MTSNFTAHWLLAAAAASLVLAGAFALTPATAQAAGYAGTSPITVGSGHWKIDVAKSHFGPDRNTMVVERAGASSNADTASNTFVVIANGKVYLATSSEASNAGGVKKIDYNRWKDMKLVQVGDNAQALDHCGFRCQSGMSEDRLTLTFKSVNGGMPEMGNLVVLNGR